MTDVVRPHFILPCRRAPGPTKGFTIVISAKRLKSRSADQSSRTPCCQQSAAMRASWTRAPAIRPAASNSRKVGQWSVDSANSTRLGEFDPGVDLVEGALKGRRRRIDTRMRDDGEKLVHARPGNRPWRRSLREFRNSLRCDVVKRRVLSMGVDKNARGDGDQPLRPS